MRQRSGDKFSTSACRASCSCVMCESFWAPAACTYLTVAQPAFDANILHALQLVKWQSRRLLLSWGRLGEVCHCSKSGDALQDSINLIAVSALAVLPQILGPRTGDRAVIQHPCCVAADKVTLLWQAFELYWSRPAQWKPLPRTTEAVPCQAV